MQPINWPHFNASQDPDAEVEAVLIPEKDLLDPDWTPKFDDESSTDDEGKVVDLGQTQFTKTSSDPIRGICPEIHSNPGPSQASKNKQEIENCAEPQITLYALLICDDTHTYTHTHTHFPATLRTTVPSELPKISAY